MLLKKGLQRGSDRETGAPGPWNEALQPIVPAHTEPALSPAELDRLRAPPNYRRENLVKVLSNFLRRFFRRKTYSVAAPRHDGMPVESEERRDLVAYVVPIARRHIFRLSLCEPQRPPELFLRRAADAIGVRPEYRLRLEQQARSSLSHAPVIIRDGIRLLQWATPSRDWFLVFTVTNFYSRHGYSVISDDHADTRKHGRERAAAP